MQKVNIQLIIVGIVVVLAALAGWGYLTYQSSQGQVSTTGSETEISSTADGETTMSDKNIMALVTNDQNSLVGQLPDVSGGTSSGMAYVLRKDGKLYHYLEADLPDPAAGSVYEGWLVNKTPSLQFFSTGVLEKADDMYTLSFMADNEYPGYDFVVVTLETEVDETPEAHIIEGAVE